MFPETVWGKPLLELIVFCGIVIAHDDETVFDMLVSNWFDMVSEQLEVGRRPGVSFPVSFGLNTGAGRAGWGCSIATDDEMPEAEETGWSSWPNWPLLCRFIFVYAIKQN